jgi:hypothetical protein
MPWLKLLALLKCVAFAGAALVLSRVATNEATEALAALAE